MLYFSGTKNFFKPTIVIAFQCAFRITITGDALKIAAIVRAKEVRDMDAGPSHSRSPRLCAPTQGIVLLLIEYAAECERMTQLS
jgi:hypothetical protein